MKKLVKQLAAKVEIILRPAVLSMTRWIPSDSHIILRKSTGFLVRTLGILFERNGQKLTTWLDAVAENPP